MPGEGLTSPQTRAKAVARRRAEAKCLVGKDFLSMENKRVGTLSREGAGDTRCSEPRGALSVTAFVMVHLGGQDLDSPRRHACERTCEGTPRKL